MKGCTFFSFVTVLYMSLMDKSSAINCKGCIPLDELTFDKMVNNFPASIVKFDVAYPYGDKHDEYAKVSIDAAERKDLFVGEVGVKDYGDKDNEELGKRYLLD